MKGQSEHLNRRLLFASSLKHVTQHHAVLSSKPMKVARLGWLQSPFAASPKASTLRPIDATQGLGPGQVA